MRSVKRKWVLSHCRQLVQRAWRAGRPLRGEPHVISESLHVPSCVRLRQN
jgi:hypothetical protein